MASYICSLGSHCQTANTLKKLSLKKNSYPFDWIFSNPEMVTSCIEDDFTCFLDKSQHISRGPNLSGHKIYGNIFNHHNITKEEDYLYFTRCVNRFKQLLKKDEDKIFFMILPWGLPEIKEINEQNNLKYQESIEKLNDILKKKTSNFKLLIINCILNYEKETNEFIKENIIYVNFTVSSPSGGIYFVGPVGKDDDKRLEDYLTHRFQFEIKDNIH